MIKKILLIEDDDALRKSIVQTLELAEFEPIPTSSFTQARRSIRSNFKGVILSDIKMPNHSGFEVLEFVQHRDEELPVVLLTGYSDVQTAIRAVRDGAYDYLEKPCDPDRLIDTMHRTLNFRNVVLQNRYYKDELDNRSSESDGGSLAELMELREREIIEQVLIRENGKVSKAAEKLGIPRNTLYDRMTKHGLVARRFRAK